MLEVCLIGGQHDGKTHFIPRITLSPPVEAIGFHLSRRQFPVRVAYAMTINKSQGQSVKYIGINFQTLFLLMGSTCVIDHRAQPFCHA